MDFAAKGCRECEAMTRRVAGWGSTAMLAESPSANNTEMYREREATSHCVACWVAAALLEGSVKTIFCLVFEVKYSHSSLYHLLGIESILSFCMIIQFFT